MSPSAAVRLCLAAAALALQPANAQAADEETQFWLTGIADFSIAEDTNTTVMLSQRFRDDAHGGDYHLARVSLDYEVDDDVAIGGGVTWVESNAGSEWRAHQQLVLSHKALSLRSQLEERFVAGADRPQLRLRERLQGSVRLDPRDKLIVSGEFLYTVQQSDRAMQPHVDSLRGSALISHKFSDRFDGRAGYMLIYAPRPNGDRIIHAPQLYLLAHF